MLSDRKSGASKPEVATLLLLLLLVLPAYGQPVPINGSLNGEQIVGTASAANGHFPDDVATPNGFYGIDTYGLPYYTRLYTPPPPKKILRAWPKPFSLHDWIVELDDGTTVILHLSGPEGAHYAITLGGAVTKTAPTDSAGWKKIFGDAIYALGTPWSSSSPVLYVSRDTLQTWELDTTGVNAARIQDFALDTAQYVYAATDNGLFMQNPDSNVWHKVTSFTQATNLSSVFVDRENRILVAGSGNGLYLSTDNGTSWNTDVSGISSAQVLLMADDAYHNLYVSTGNPFLGPIHIYKSVGGTGAWQVSDSSIVRIAGSASFENMKINSISGDSALVAGTSFGVFLSTDQGTTWAMNNTGIRAENIAGMAKTTSGGILLSTALGVFSNTPPDTSWNKIYPQNGIEGSLNLYHDTLGNIYTTDPQFPLSLSNGAAAVIKSTDGGTSWSPDTAGLSAVNGGRIFYVDEAGGQHSAGYQFSTPNMYVWTKQPGGSWAIDTTGFPTQSSYPVAMTSDRNGYLYTSGTISTDRVMRRLMGGGAWAADTTGIPQSVSYFGNMTPGLKGDVYGVVGYYGPGLMRRSAGSWSNFPLPPSLTSQYITGVSVDKSGAVFVAFVDYNNVPLGVYFTADGGTSWTHAGLDSVYVTSLVSFGDSTYALSSNAGAFYVGKNPSITGVRNSTSTPRSFVLFQNFPNPFNPTTTIQFSIGKSSIVDLKIFDLLGREVGTLVHGEMSAGEHEVSFDASKLASGIYFYKLRAGSFTETKKLVLLK